MLAIHDRLLAEHGGAAGLRELALLESALARPQQVFAYGKPSLFELAAAYAASIIRNHPFVDGNKRTGFMAAYVFLGRNQVEFVADESEVVVRTLALAGGKMTEKEYASWLEQNSQRTKKQK